LEPEDRNRLAVSFTVGLVIVLLVFGGFYLAMRFSGQSKPASEKPLAFGPAEQSYVANLNFENLEMSAFENMLHQKVTYLNGDISNRGTRTVRAADITVEFYGAANKLVLRETHRIIGNGTRPLETGETRAFQIGFEAIPASWNHQFPAIRVTGLDLE
jgi:hypothetical protein